MFGSDGVASRFGVAHTRLAFLILALLLAAFGPLSSARAQDDVDALEDLKKAREDVLSEAADTAEKIDVQTATVEELSEALDELNAFVRLQESRLEDAQREVDAAHAAVEAATTRREVVRHEVEDVRDHIADLALSSFTGESGAAGDDMTELAFSEDPGEAARILHLVQVQTGSLSDSMDRMRALEVEAQMLILEEEAAVEAVAAGLAIVEERTAELEVSRDRQLVLVTAAETQLEARLAEAAFLEDRDLDLARKIRDQQQAINQRVAVAARNIGVEIPDPVDLEEIVLITFEEFDSEFEIEVHEDIEEQTRALFTEAFEDGIDLGGWGYRPIQLQIELRAAHCGGTEYDIWQKPVFECAPPTARPGFSKHEQGRAIDFTYRGSSVKTQDSPGFRWLAEHAPAYGFVNLDVEPWHWSID